MPLQASILTPSPVPLASGLRAILPEVPAHPRSPGGSSSSFGSGRPNGLSATVPCLQRAFAAYPRPDEAGPAVFHDPLHAARLWIVRAYRDRPTLTSRPPAAARSRSRGFAAPASRTAEKRLFTALTLGLGAARESGGVKQFAAFLARENQGCACCRVVRSRPTARMTASMVFRVGLPLSLNER